MSKSTDQVSRLAKEMAEKRGFNLSAIAVRERSVTLFFFVLIVSVGVLAYLKLGRAEDPKFTVKVFTVVAAWPGATATGSWTGSRPRARAATSATPA